MRQDIHRRVQEALSRISIVATSEGRDSLLDGIPHNLRDSLYRYPANKTVDLIKLIEQLDRLGPLEKDGTRPLLIFLKNAQKTVAGSLNGRILQDLIDELAQQNDEDISPTPPALALPTIPEVNIFGGSDERLPYTFFIGALRVQKSIARLHVPRIFGSFYGNKSGNGTGWLITSQLILTNYHVIAARETHEAPASAAEIKGQAEHTSALFDYHTEGVSPSVCPCVELVYANNHLDYALLRLSYPPTFEHRSPLTIVRHHHEQYTASRLNIVQHSGNKPLQYAIRNNFYIGYDENSHTVRYLTHTENGASGSPVFNDKWHVVALHRASVPMPKQSYKGEPIEYYNEGTEIHTIFDDLPVNVKQEIYEAQGW